MELHFLGTGAGLPSRERNVTAIGLRFTRRPVWWLFDCGEGTQQQLLRSPLRLSRLTQIFISHLHGDHIYGLPGLLGSRSFQAPDIPLGITGPPGIQAYVEMTLGTSQTHLTYPLTIRELDTDETTFCMDDITITAARLNHVVPSWGYRIALPAQPGKLKLDVLARFGLPPGPLYAKLKRGEDVQSESGETIRAKDVVGPAQPGIVAAVLGDTSSCDAAVTLARNADILVHEATFAASEQDKAQQYGHSTSLDAAQTAKAAGAKQLILTHISARYQERGVTELVTEAKSIFANTSIASDGDIFPCS